MKRIRVVCTAQATIRETWTFEVADELVVDEDVAMELINGGNDVPGVMIGEVEDETIGGEVDREFETWADVATP